MSRNNNNRNNWTTQQIQALIEARRMTNQVNPNKSFLFFKDLNSVNIYYNLFRRTTIHLVLRDPNTGTVSLA